LHETQLAFIDVVDENDQSVAMPVKKDDSGKHLVAQSDWMIVPEKEPVGEYYYVSKLKLRQLYAKSIGKKGR